MKRLFTAILLLFSSGCAYYPGFSKVEQNIDLSKADEIYTSWVEKSYCLSWDGKIENIQRGLHFWSPSACCDESQISVHTHPCYGETVPNWWDFIGWVGDYESGCNRSGLFGLYHTGTVKVYRYEKKEPPLLLDTP